MKRYSLHNHQVLLSIGINRYAESQYLVIVRQVDIIILTEEYGFMWMIFRRCKVYIDEIFLGPFNSI